MAGYPWIYWLVVLIAAGAVSTVLIGIGYLLGRAAEQRAAAVGLRVIDQSLGRLRDALGTLDSRRVAP
ncbi:MAG: hypothetical protein ACRCTG_11040 [Aestuariivirga sp.]